MPPVVGAAAAGLASGLAGFTIGALSVTATAFVVAGANLGLGLISGALTRRDDGFSVAARDRLATGRATNQNRQLNFGEVMTGGTLGLWQSSGTDNEHLYLNLLHQSGPAASIRGWVANDELVGETDSAGNVVAGRFKDHLRLVPHLGAFDQAAAPNLLAELENWTEDHKLGGIAYTEARLKWSADVWPNGFSGLRALVRGMPLYDPRDTGEAIASSDAAGVFAFPEPHGFTAGQNVWIKGHAGATQTIGGQTVRWTGKWHQVASVPTPTTLTLIDEDGQPVAFATGGTGGTATPMVWSDNWALCIRAFLCHRWGYNARNEEIDDTATIVAANICDEQVALTPEPKTFQVRSSTVTVDVDNDLLEPADEVPFVLGHPVRIASTGTPPAPLVAGTIYYSVPSSVRQVRGPNSESVSPVFFPIVDGLRLAASLADAEADNFITITDAGTGTHSVVDATNQIFVEGGATWKTGDVVRLTTTGTLPAGPQFAVDYSQGGNDGVFISTPLWVAGKIGRTAISHANTNAVVRVDDADFGSGTNNVQGMECWFQHGAATAHTFLSLSADRGVSNADQTNIGINTSGQIEFRTTSGGAATTLRSNSSGYNDGQSHHVAAIYTPTGRKLIVDGTDINTDSSTFTLAQMLDFQTGTGMGQGSGGNFPGVVDDPRLWSDERTTGEIQANKDAALRGDEQGLVGYWRYDEGIIPGEPVFLVRFSATQYGLAATLEDARAGVLLGLGDAGVGDHTASRESQLRYTCNGTVEVGKDENYPWSALEKMTTAAAGLIVRQEGLVKIFAGAATAATGTLTESDKRAGPLKGQGHLDWEKTFNAARGTFVDPDKFWTPGDAPTFVSATARAEDAGELIYGDLDLEFTTDPTMAQRLLKIALERTRQGATMTFTAKPRKFATAVWDVEAVTIAHLSYAAKPFRVMSVRENPDFGIDLSLREEAPESWDWNLGDETTTDPAPNTASPDPFVVQPPTALTMTEQLYRTREGGGVKSRAVLSWAAAADAFVTRGGDYVAQYKLASESEFIVLQPTIHTTVQIDDLLPGVYEFQVFARNSIGVRSSVADSPSLTKEIFGLPGPPGPVTGLTLFAAGGTAGLRWDQHSDLDVREGGTIQFRHSPLLTGATWQGSTSIGDPVDGLQTSVSLPLKQGTYLAKAFDSSGTPGLDVTTVSTKQASVQAFANVGTLIEHPSFPGTHAGTAGVDGVLKLGGATLVDDWPDFDAIADVDTEGGLATSGTYTFAAGFDFGSVRRVRLTNTIQALVVNTFDSIDDRTGLVDDWEDWDGVEVGSADAVVEVRVTDDDPGGSPNWSPWQRMDAAEYETRGVQARVRLTTTDPAYNIHISQLSISADEVT